MAGEFDQAAADMKNLKSKPSDADLLELYKLYKQATIGDINTARPGMLSLDLAGKAKWDAWNSCKGMSTVDSQQAYVAKSNQMKEQYGF